MNVTEYPTTPYVCGVCNEPVFVVQGAPDNLYRPCGHTVTDGPVIANMEAVVYGQSQLESA